MYAITIANDILKRYKLQWYGFVKRRRYVIKTRILHNISLQDVKEEALRLFGKLPDNIQRI